MATVTGLRAVTLRACGRKSASLCGSVLDRGLRGPFVTDNSFQEWTSTSKPQRQQSYEQLAVGAEKCALKFHSLNMLLNSTNGPWRTGKSFLYPSGSWLQNEALTEDSLPLGQWSCSVLLGGTCQTPIGLLHVCEASHCHRTHFLRPIPPIASSGGAGYQTQGLLHARQMLFH